MMKLDDRTGLLDAIESLVRDCVVGTVTGPLVAALTTAVLA